MESHQGLQGQTGIRLLQVDIETVLRAGDLRESEMRIQQEVTSLSAALVVNSTRIQ